MSEKPEKYKTKNEPEYLIINFRVYIPRKVEQIIKDELGHPQLSKIVSKSVAEFNRFVQAKQYDLENDDYNGFLAEIKEFRLSNGVIINWQIKAEEEDETSDNTSE